jgi:protein-S-isoprenylcysteine O-methyltransferase Ste14
VTNFFQRGGGWVVAQALLMLAVVVAALLFRGNGGNVGMVVFGIILLGLGAVVGFAGAIALGRNLTPFPRPSQNTQLVRRGVYAWMRHPLYTSVMAASLGWALMWQSWPAWWVAVLLIPFFDAKARREERWLRATFPEYAEYARRVRRFIPWIY